MMFSLHMLVWRISYTYSSKNGRVFNTRMYVYLKKIQVCSPRDERRMITIQRLSWEIHMSLIHLRGRIWNTGLTLCFPFILLYFATHIVVFVFVSSVKRAGIRAGRARNLIKIFIDSAALLLFSSQELEENFDTAVIPLKQRYLLNSVSNYVGIPLCRFTRINNSCQMIWIFIGITIISGVILAKKTPKWILLIFPYHSEHELFLCNFMTSFVHEIALIPASSSSSREFQVNLWFLLERVSS